VIGIDQGWGVCKYESGDEPELFTLKNGGVAMGNTQDRCERSGSSSGDELRVTVASGGQRDDCVYTRSFQVGPCQT
jgi:hypothetical protein